ncbi:uncharacterized protein LOC123895782 [Trifolium pratense]|uniref:uncharacterized protein LOC123895782 n=1 Tax=Trifolium pratense TaxID=57577 RepID=UPI001E69113D|nr:uncharacterized protein LOC123895782 [Trifolium pratense]
MAPADHSKGSLTATKSFAQALSNSCNIPISNLAKPCLKGEQISIKITEVEYLAGVLDCQNVLHGRFTLPKGSSPIRMQDLKERILKFWKTNEQWSMVSLGKGYFEFIFSSLDDLSVVRSIGFWNLSSGLLRTFAWSADFNPFTVQPTNAQIWIRIHGLAREYWRPYILFEIVGAVGTPLALDEATKKRTFGHFARILIDVDLNSNLRERILIERNDFDFYVDVEYENIPPFCNACQIIGHSLKNCKYQNPPKATTSLVNKRKMETVTMSSASEPLVIASNQGVADVDPLIEDLTRDKEVEEAHAIDLAKKPRVDPLSITPDLRIVGSWSDAVTDLDYIQDPPSWCSTSSNVTASDVGLNPHVAHDLEILRNWKDYEASDIGHRVYTDEEETATTINYLKNRSAAVEEPFTDVVSKAKKKKSQKGFPVRYTRSMRTFFVALFA